MFRIKFNTILALVVAALFGVVGLADAASAGTPAAKRAHKLALGDSRTIVDVKFLEGTDVRRQGDDLVSQSSGRIAALDRVLARFPDVKVSRLFKSSSEARLDASRREAREYSGRRQADLNLYFRIYTKKSTDTVALIEALNGLEVVEAATPAMKAVKPPITPSFTDRQGYRLAAANGGIDADFAHTLTGGKGDNVRIVDVEYSWNRSHEDLSKARVAGSALANGTPCDPFAQSMGAHSADHGTAVLGELVGDPNGFGVTGLAPNASLLTVNAASRNSTTGYCEVNLAAAITVAANNTAKGDVILIEQQAGGPRWTNPKSDVGYVPVEWNSGVHAAIKSATASGRIVIEPAGNGYQNLDDPVYNNVF